MSKKLFLLFICAAFIAFMGVGCKGKRSVRVVVEHNDTWSMEMILGDSKSPVMSDNESRTYPLGDFETKLLCAVENQHTDRKDLRKNNRRF